MNTKKSKKSFFEILEEAGLAIFIAGIAFFFLFIGGVIKSDVAAGGLPKDEMISLTLMLTIIGGVLLVYGKVSRK